MAQTVNTSVIVLGGSLVGLANAMFLAARGVPHIVIERHAGSAAHPRAIGYTTRTIELFRSIGADKLLPTVPLGAGKPRRVSAKTLIGDWADETHWTKPGGGAGGPPGKGPGGPGGPGKGPGGPGGPPDLSIFSPVRDTPIAQDKLEPIMRQRALELGSDLRLGWKMTSWSQDADNVTVTAVDKDGNELKATGKYLVACDGAQSQVREDLGITGYGVGYMRTLRSIMFRCPSIEEYAQRGISQWSLKNDETGVEAFLVHYPDGRWAAMSYNESEDGLDEAGRRAYIEQAVGRSLSDIELVTFGKWDLRGSIADQFRAGRVFLAGDAAHTLPPNRGGYGANTGISDAHNLAWKLEAVLNGEATDSLLDTYHDERHAIAVGRHDQLFSRDDYKEHIKDTEWARKHPSIPILNDIAIELGQIYKSSAVVGAEDPSLAQAKTPIEWEGQPGTRAAHIVMTKNDEEISSLDLFCKGWLLISEDASWKATAAALTKGPKCDFVQVGQDAKEKAEGSFKKAYGLEASGATLIRPDGYIAARWVSRPADADEAFAKAFSKVAHTA